MRAYEGTVMAVVHDRFFIERFATALWVVERGGVRRYIDLAEWRRARSGRGLTPGAADLR
jgi:ATPase subunit of ABC transporter with duplicated ATPase domains